MGGCILMLNGYPILRDPDTSLTDYQGWYTARKTRLERVIRLLCVDLGIPPFTLPDKLQNVVKANNDDTYHLHVGVKQALAKLFLSQLAEYISRYQADIDKVDKE